MKLSACLIVKNEEAVIGRCLESIAPHVDEIVVVDTGSTDETLNIIERFRLTFSETEKPFKTCHFDWTGNFSDARNYSMDLATGDVILIIDADEYVTTGWESIRDAIGRSGFVCGTMQVINTTRQGAVKGERIIQPRLFLNHPEIRYYYAIHNQIEESVHRYAKKMYEAGGETALICQVDAEIVHTGYDLSEEEVVAKYTPRLETMREEIERADGEGNVVDAAFYRYNMALMLHMVRRQSDALPLWDALEFDNLNTPNMWYGHYIAARAFLAEGDYDKALMHCEGMFRAHEGNNPPIAEEPASHMIAGVVYCFYSRETKDRAMLERGIAFLCEAYLKNLIHNPRVRCLMDPSNIQSDIVEFMKDIDSGASLLVETETIPAKLIAMIKQIQRHLFTFDDSLLDLIER